MSRKETVAQPQRPTSYPKEKIKFLLTEGLHQSAVDNLKQAGYSNIHYEKAALSHEELKEQIQDAHILGIRSKTQVTADIIENAKKLIGIGCFCIGTNQVDLEAATHYGITVFNSPYSNTRSVAELVLSEAVQLIRRIPEKNAAAHRGEWLKTTSGSYELRGKTLGIIGYGHIGSQVSILAESFGMNVKYYDIVPKLPLGNARPVDTLEELLGSSDIVTLHVPATEDTQFMMNDETLAHMKEGSILLNLSRGKVVDIEALQKRIEKGQITGAGIDVFPKEPKSKDELFESPLQGSDNVILTPHIGGSTLEAQENIGKDVSTKLINLLDNGSTVGSHTVPPLNLPQQANTRRILHVHQNMPGILSEINSILRDMDINISGQYLKTNSDIGYVVLDIEGKDKADQALIELRKIEHTIRSRILY